MEAVRHDCGWAVTSGGVNAGEELREPPASREVVEAALAKIRGKLKVPTKYKTDEAVIEKPKVPMLPDVGHGERCTCESCWITRLQTVFPGARVVGKSKTMPGFVDVAYQKRTAPQAVAEKADAHPVNEAAEPPAPPAVAVPVAAESRLERLKRMFPV